MLGILLIQVTKKLAEQLNIKTTKEQLIENNPIYSWHAHVFNFKRRKYVLVMNNKSRYNFTLGSLVKKDFMRFDELVKNGIKENLLDDGFDSHIVEKYMEKCDTEHFAPTSERKIISQINEMIRCTIHGWNYNELEANDINLCDVNRSNNKFVMLNLPETYSVDSMANALKEIED